MSTSGLLCSRCGMSNDAQAAFCAKCGTSLQSTDAFNTPVFAQAPAPGIPGQFGPGTATAAAYASPMYPAAVPPVSYAGFWIRFLAYIIDTVVMSLVSLPIFFVAVTSLSAAAQKSLDPQVGNMAILAIVAIIFLVSVGGGWLYFAVMESSSKQGTLGKMVLKLKVTDLNGNRLGFGRATGRYFAKWINSFALYVGWIIAGFTARKQGLHDFIAGTLVLKTH